MNGAHFTCTALAGTNLAGELKPDKDGYYTMVLGAYEYYNSANEYYPFASAKEFFQSSSSFIRRVKGGCIRGEYKHPVRQPGWTDAEWIQRILDIDLDRACAVFGDIWIDNKTIKGSDGNYIIAVIGKVKPWGPYSKYLVDLLNDPRQNVCWSVRCLTENMMARGRREKHLRVPVTYDLVNEPGIDIAVKWKSPALECLVDNFITEASLEEAVYAIDNSQVATESTRAMASELKSLLSASKTRSKTFSW